ncbi:chromatin assembly factor I P60 subunit-like protein [Sarcoptes scabiei]|uniref:Chromatin assembly factor I P60 subunit-like protein n=1 Tax=Sarcoptes scabiei TaxID=52283 RepID=A0A132A492_SARSC|nr:chromatin assembly factor I P60 subunit-like protein [Sarcoptes scabiei]
MQAKPHYFRSGVLEIKCIATLILVYEYEAIENLVTGSSRNKKNLEWSLQPNIRTPVIVGMKQNYRLDENLNINCTSSIENAKLKWFINFNEANQSDLIQYRTEPNRFILGLWIRMDKHLLQMTELKLRCISLFFKQINQFNSTLKIRTFDQRNDGNHFGEESEWHHNEAKDIPLISATGGNDSHVIIWKLSLDSNDPLSKVHVECLAELTKHQRSVNVVRFSPNQNENLLASGDDDSLIFIWKYIESDETSSATLKSKLIDLNEESNRDQAKDETRKSGSENFIDSDIITIETWKTHKILRGHSQDVSDLCWSHDGQHLVSGIPYRIVFAVATENSVLFYDSQNLLPFAYVSQLHYLRLTDISWSPDSRMLMITSTDGFSSFVIFDANELGNEYHGPMMNFEESDAMLLSAKTSNKSSNSSNSCTNESGSINKFTPSPVVNEKEKSKLSSISSSKIMEFFRKSTNSPTESKSESLTSESSPRSTKLSKSNQNIKVGRRVSLITLFDPKKSQTSSNTSGVDVSPESKMDIESLPTLPTGIKRKQSDDSITEEC